MLEKESVWSAHVVKRGKWEKEGHNPTHIYDVVGWSWMRTEQIDQSQSRTERHNGGENTISLVF